jgi:hypothetical protein
LVGVRVGVRVRVRLRLRLRVRLRLSVRDAAPWRLRSGRARLGWRPSRLARAHPHRASSPAARPVRSRAAAPAAGRGSGLAPALACMGYIVSYGTPCVT